MKVLVIGANRFTSKKGNDTLLLTYVSDIQTRTSETGQVTAIGQESDKLFIGITELENVIGIALANLKLEDLINQEYEVSFNRSGFCDRIVLL